MLSPSSQAGPAVPSTLSEECDQQLAVVKWACAFFRKCGGMGDGALYRAPWVARIVICLLTATQNYAPGLSVSGGFPVGDPGPTVKAYAAAYPDKGQHLVGICDAVFGVGKSSEVKIGALCKELGLHKPMYATMWACVAGKVAKKWG